jgi:hypothetical protein
MALAATIPALAQKPMETLHRAEIQFLAEQKGAFEDKVKAALLPTLKAHPQIKRAYLVSIIYGESERSVALCLSSTSSADMDVVTDVNAVFSSIAGADLHLDVVFVSEEQHRRIAQIAEPFYVAA